MTARLPVTILGATGAVGQKFVALLADHPWFAVTRVCASERNAGRRYGDAVHWLEPEPPSPAVADLVLQPAEPADDEIFAFSALDAAAAETVEPAFAAAGRWVVTNARSHRMAPDVPLLIPEVNPEALRRVDDQRRTRKWSGAIVANPNCSVVVLASALAPLQRAFGVETAVVSTMQAVSGAGYPGLPSLDALGNVIPYIGGGEEEKIEQETGKILETTFPLSVHVNRVPVVDGHTVAVSVRLTGHPDAAAVHDALAGFRPPADVAGLPSAPADFLLVHSAPDRPQPRLDAGRGRGMTVSVGRVRPCPVFDVRFVALGHNTIRGAAGAAVLNAELLVQRGRVARPR